MVVVIQLMSNNLEQTLDSRNQIIATELVQEGIELVRNMRDNNWAANVDTFHNFPGSSSILSETGCIIDYNSSSLNCGGGNSGQLYMSGNFYAITSTSNKTKFYRNISIVYDSNPPNTAQITSMVIWSGLSSFPTIANCTTNKQCAYAQTTLTKWGGD